MTKMIIALLGLLSAISLTSCGKELIEYEQGDIKVCIEQGREWLHDFPVFLGIKNNDSVKFEVVQPWLSR